MAKAGKRGKSAEVKTVTQSGTRWDQVLTNISFEEESWNPCVTWVVGRQPADFKHIDALNVIIQTGLRKLFSVVTKDELLLDVKDIGNPKNRKAKEIPPYSDVCEACKPYVDADEPIPLPLLAKLIKWKFLSVKSADLRRREAEVKKSPAMSTSDAVSDKKKGGKDPAKERAKSPPKKGKKTPDNHQQAKEGSKLRKRGEEDADQQCIDDEPDDGPHHYIIVTGIHEPRIFSYLEEIGVTVSSIIGVSAQLFESPKKDDDLTEHDSLPALPNISSSELSQFWKDLLPLLQHLPDSSKLHDIARLEYEVKPLETSVDASEAELKVQYSMALFEDIAVMLYDLQDAKRLYKTFLENLNLVKIPEVGQVHTEKGDRGDGPHVNALSAKTGESINESGATPGQTETVSGEIDMRYYNDLMSTIPHESVSVTLVMHCMLEQITATEEGKIPPSEVQPPKRSDGLNFYLASYLSELTGNLALTEMEHQELSSILDLPASLPEEASKPDLINHHDRISHRTKHLKTIYGLNANKVEQNMLRFSPFDKLCDFPDDQPNEIQQRAARLQELMHFCATGGLSKAEVDHAFKQFVFECIDLDSTDPNGFLIERQKEGLHHVAVPWDDPYPYYKYMIPITEKPSTERLASISNCSSFIQDLNTGACTPDMEKKISSHRNSSESKRGILVNASPRASSASSRRSRSHSASVHWEPELMEELELDTVVMSGERRDSKHEEDSLMDIVEVQRRNLDQWCFTEHYDRNVLLQVLEDAAYYLPFVETYQHKRDKSLMLVLHNPYSDERQSNIDWHCELHSNLGFRNYLEYTADNITEWLKEKEAEYQAQILSQEVDSINKEEEERARATEKEEKKKKPASRSKSPKSGSRSNSAEALAPPLSDPYIRQGSLKALKAEQSRVFNEELQKEKSKTKRLSAKAKAKEDKDKEKQDNKSPRMSSSKSRVAKSAVEGEKPAAQEVTKEEDEEEEKYWPFSGYNTGNHLIHVSGITTTLFPSDGGQIKTERTEFVQSTVSVRSVVQKDGHIFTVHILNPREDMNLPDEYELALDKPQDESLADNQETIDKSETEKAEKDLDISTSINDKQTGVNEKSSKSSISAEDELSLEELDERSEQEKITSELGEETQSKEEEVKQEHRKAHSQFGSITGHLCDGMLIALSQFGRSGESYLKPYIPEMPSPLVEAQEAASVVNVAPSPVKTKKDTKKYAESEKESDSKDVKEPDVPKPKSVKKYKQPFQELFVTCPDGLSIKYFLQSSVGVSPKSSDDRQLAVQQSYPFKTKGVQPCESKRNKYIQSELSRVIIADGTVIKTMLDGTVEVLGADGTVSVYMMTLPEESKSETATDVEESSGSLQKGKSSSGKLSKASKTSNDVGAEMDVEEVPTTGKRGWLITHADGERMKVIEETGTCEELAPTNICTATDPDTEQIMATRDDHVIIVSFPDGKTIVEHADGTRITVYYRQEPESVTASTSAMTNRTEKKTIKFVKVECPAFATMEFNTDTTENLTVFGTGTSINVFPDGYYILHHRNGGRVEIDTEGTMVYFPRRSRFVERIIQERELHYTLRHNAEVIVETIDPDGNIFNVRSTGDFSVVPQTAGDNLSDLSENNSVKKELKVLEYRQHAPRFFILHPDCSGTELLRYKDVAEYLTMSEQNPATAIIKDSLHEHPAVNGISVLKPYLTGPSEKWIKNYDLESIIPKGIRCRDLITLPPKEFKKPGPIFGTNVGQGLNVGSLKTPTRVPILKCPSTLETRHFVQYKPITEPMRVKFQNGLQNYADAVVARMKSENLMSVEDGRSIDEKQNAEEILNNFMSRNNVVAFECNKDNVKQIYENAVAPPLPSPPRTPPVQRTAADWERDKREIEEERIARETLKNKDVGKYFDSELGKAFLIAQSYNMEEAMIHLAEDMRRDGSQAIRAEQVKEVETRSESAPKTEPSPVSNGFVNEGLNVTPPTGLRPQNPTPAHATGTGSPSVLRPKNPTPYNASKPQADRPGNPTPKLALGTLHTNNGNLQYAGDKSTIFEEDATEPELEPDNRNYSHPQSLTKNVIGAPRTEPVRLPTSIMGGRPGALVNQKFLTIEQPVKRPINTSIIAGATEPNKLRLKQMDGLICQPENVDFGVLKEGNTYVFTVYLKNIGIDARRFQIKQPPPATGLRVRYKPGLIAAGMSCELGLELYAIANGVEGDSGVGSLSHVLEVNTETHILKIPIVATILTAHEYDKGVNSTGKILPTSAKLISNKPPATSGIIRPLREQK